MHKRFVLQRDEDETGISGTGVVAEGVEFSDGVVALRWLVPASAPGAGNPTSVVFHDNGISSVEKIHGHNGKTKIVWEDDRYGQENWEQEGLMEAADWVEYWWDSYAHARNPVDAAAILGKLQEAIFDLSTYLPGFDARTGRVEREDE